MSTSRHLLLLSCTPALVVACANRPELVHSKPAVPEVPRWGIESERRAAAPRAAAPKTKNPYEPIRLRTAATYSWRSEKPAQCPPGTLALETEEERGNEPKVAPSILAALPERRSDPESRGQPLSADLVVLGLRPALRHCFSRWLDARADAQGSVRFALDLGCAGEIEAISAENQGVDESTLACLFSAVAPARFAPPAGGHATVLMPVVFKNSGR